MEVRQKFSSSLLLLSSIFWISSSWVLYIGSKINA